MNHIIDWKNNTGYTDNVDKSTRKRVRKLNRCAPILKDTNNAVEHFHFEDYNCGGFAVGTFDWLHIENRKMHSFLSNSYNQQTTRDKKLALVSAAKELEKNFNLRPLKNPRKIKEGEYLIGFRLSNRDFHFIRQMSNGKWLHKPASKPIQEISNEDVYGVWCPDRYDGGYDSKTIWFAKKIDKV